MSRPLIISDCDEVLLHMVVPFRDWLAEAHGIEFVMEDNSFANALRRDGVALEPAEIWRLLRAFFDTEMPRQLPIAGAPAALAELGRHADIVILTNLTDGHRDARARQLADHGIHARVFTNQGPKGPALKAILDEYAPPRALFIDDLAQHHRSVGEIAPDVTRLHFCGEPLIAGRIDCAHRAGDAAARIDTWNEALPWLLARLTTETVPQ